MRRVLILGLILLLVTPGLSQREANAAKKRARLYLQQGDLDQARNLFEQWLTSHPEDVQAYRELINIYRRQGDYLTMANQIRNRLRDYPNDMQAQMELGEAFYLQEKPDSARQVWDRFRQRYASNQTAIRMLVFTYSRLNLEEDLVETVTEARRTFTDPGFMAQELANYYQLRRDYSHATDEYLRLLRSRRDRESFVRDKLLVMSDEADDPSVIEMRLLNSDSPSPAQQRILAAYYFKTGQIEKAFSIHRDLGWATAKDINRWLSFANNLRKDHRIPEAITAYQAILSHGDLGKRQQTGRALLGLAQTFEDQIIPDQKTMPQSGFLPSNLFFNTPYYFDVNQAPASLQSALALYDSILVTMPQSKFTAAAHLRLGEIQFRITRDFDRAFANYQAALQAGPSRDDEALIRLRLGQLYLAQGNLDGATAYFSRLKNQGDSFMGPYLLTRFLQSELKDLETLLDSTLTGLSGAESEFNDMVELQDILSTYFSQGSDSDREALKRWAQAERLLWADKLNEAADQLAWIRTQWPESALNSLLLWREAELRRLIHQPDQALELAQELTTSDRGDHGWLLIGEIMEFERDDQSEALEAYYHILNDWPQSILYEPVRHHIRELTQETES